jgi:hypothetical protein
MDAIHPACYRKAANYDSWVTYGSRRQLRMPELKVSSGRTQKFELNSLGTSAFEGDYAATKLCFLSILWRMSISKHPSFAEVQLGPFESPACVTPSPFMPISRMITSQHSLSCGVNQG